MAVQRTLVNRIGVGSSSTADFLMRYHLVEVVEQQKWMFNTAEYLYNRAWDIKEAEKVIKKDRIVYQGMCGNGSSRAILFYMLEDELPVALVTLHFMSSQIIEISVYSNSYEKASTILEDFKKQIPEKEPPKQPNSVVFGFWRLGNTGKAKYSERILECPTWADASGIKANYTKEVQESIDSVIELAKEGAKPEEQGKIIIWHGPPGTGKTHLVRALALAWSRRLKQQVSVEYILDPEQLFGLSDYMVSVTLCDDEEENKKAETRLRLIVIEDSAELFSVNCRNTAGFSRFLNLTDGIIGQGARIIFLLTANEKIEHIDPAVKRAGRALNITHVDAMNPEEADAWRSEHGLVPIGCGASLADLYADLKTGKAKLSEAARIGF